MAKRSGLRYVCSNCGSTFATWMGRCSNCGEWNTLQEQVDTSAAAGSGKTLHIETVTSVAKKDILERLATGIADIDTVLGGGIVVGSVVLVAGQPGIGKSTLLQQIGNAVAAATPVLYVSGEESAHQVGLRSARLGLNHPHLQIAASTSANDIAATIATGEYKLVIIDSVQTMTVSEVASAPGTVSQITNSTRVIMTAAKRHNCAVLLVGHVTKEGEIAGPKVLEHVVDVVLQLEGDRYGGFKILRSMKNRFGPTDEAAILSMTETGLQPVLNPSAALLAERQTTDGSVVLATIEGSRAVLVEVQALVNKTAFGYPKRTASGIDLNRVTLLIAMLERRTKLKLGDNDIYVNIVGGIRVTEPAADLAVCMAIASAAKGLQLKKNAVVFGEVGLSGEVRHVPYIDKRVHEAQKLGFDAAIGPVSDTLTKNKFYVPVREVRTSLNQFLEKD